jgi:Txe/YoeB family toxin of Txe-Axe toxin-antitoxin module
MATVVWTDKAKVERRKLYITGQNEFGVTTAIKMSQKIETITNNLKRWPVTGFPEPLLKGLVPLYRSRHINKRFKIVYWYDEPNDTVVIEDIWDSRRSPQNLKNRIRK